MSLIKRLRRARSESGHTLMELVVAMSIGMIILLVAFHLLDRSLGLTREVSDRVDAVQRGRLAMDTMTRQLRSQVCLATAAGTGTDAALSAASGDSVTFYSNLSATGVPEKDTLTFDEAARTLIRTRIDGSGAAPFTTHTAAPKNTTLLNNAARNGPSPTANPIFTYYGFDNSVPPKAVKQLTPMPLTQAQRESTARIVVSFVSRPAQATTTNKKAAVLTDEIFVRSADPNDPAPVPKCA
jgi:type II secretory pathway pseudopilin PulG